MFDLGLLSWQILDDSLNRDLFPPNLLPLKTVMQQNVVTLLASFRKMFFFSLNFKTIPLDRLLHIPRRPIVLYDVIDDRKQLLKWLPISQSDSSDNQVGFVLQTQIFKHIFEGIDVLLYVCFTFQYFTFEGVLLAAHTTFLFLGDVELGSD